MALSDNVLVALRGGQPFRASAYFDAKAPKIEALPAPASDPRIEKLRTSFVVVPRPIGPDGSRVPDDLILTAWTLNEDGTALRKR